MRILSLLSDMQARRNHIAIVVDEHGGTEGLVTIEDIVEEIIGEVADEFDKEPRYVTKIADNEWVIDGRCGVEEAQDFGLPVEESDEYETVAGWMLVRLGHIPVVGETVDVEGTRFIVQAVRRRRIVRLVAIVEQMTEHEGGSRTDGGAQTLS